MATQVDHAEIKLGQLLTMAMAALAFALNEPLWLIALGVIFLVTGLIRSLSPFVLLYRYMVKPLNIMHSDYRLDNIQPHAFGQLIGALTVVIALGLYFMEYQIAAWVVVAVLFVLTLVSYLGWCIGCFMYYQLNRQGVKGFFRHKPTDSAVILGQRPGKKTTD